MENYKWVRAEVDINAIVNPTSVITIKNSGVLELDFKRYAKDFNEAANFIMLHLLTDAADKGNIAELDLWYYSLTYLYRQSIELLVKANIFRFETDDLKRQDILRNVGHNVKAGFDELLKLSGVDISDNKNAEWLSLFLEDISKIDEKSDNFRYPFNHKKEAIFKKQTHIDLKAVFYNMNRAYELLNDFYYNNEISKDEYRDEVSYEPKLIVNGTEYYYQSVVGYKYAEGSYFPYNTSYAECGEYLKKVIDETGKTNLFMPMCYLYRNALELGLKKIIMESSCLDNDKALKIINKKKHSLLGLWNSIKDELKEHAYSETDPTIDNVQKYIEAFHSYDFSSTKFRYPCSKEMELYFASETQVDIDNISDCFIELIHFLDGADATLLYDKECEAEMASYYSEMEAEMLSDCNDFFR